MKYRTDYKNQHYRKVRGLVKQFGYDKNTGDKHIGIHDVKGVNSGWYKFDATSKRWLYLNDDFNYLARHRTMWFTLQLYDKTPSAKLPKEPDIKAQKFFFDVDLKDEIKKQLKESNGARTPEIRDIGKRCIEFIRDKLLAIFHPDSILFLDSGGGFYPVIHHNITRPLAELKLTDEEKTILWKDLNKKFNNRFMVNLEQEAIEQVDGFKDTFKFDCLNMLNRQCKAPFTVHLKQPTFVHVIPIDNPDFQEEFIPITDTKLLEQEEEILKEPTREQALEDLERLIAMLYPEYQGNWKERLFGFIEWKKAENKKWEKIKAEQTQRLQKQYDKIQELDKSSNIQDIFDAIATVNMYELVPSLATTTDRGDSIRFDPPYRSSKTGQSCFIIDEEHVNDNDGNIQMGPIQFVGACMKLVRPGEYPKSKDFWKCVDKLRQLGFKIPEFEPYKKIKLPDYWKEIFGMSYDKTRENLIKMFKKGNPLKTHKMATVTERRTAFKTLLETNEILYYWQGCYYFHGGRVIKNICENMLQELADILEEHNIAWRWNKTVPDEVTGHIRRRNLVSLDKFDENPNILNVQNCLINLETGHTTDHTPDHLSLKQLQVDYDKDATCHEIDKFLSEIVEPENLPILYEIPASCMGDLMKFHKAYMLLGNGRNGKSKYLNLLETLLGRDNVASVSLQDLNNNRFKPARLLGAFANISGDLSTKAVRYTGILKQLTGEDTIEIEKKGKDAVLFRNKARMVFACNQTPEVDDDSYAFWRRWIIVRFPYTFSENPGEGDKPDDPDISDKITTPEELSGFLNKIIETYHTIQENNCLTETEDVLKQKEEWKKNANPMYGFVNECLTKDVNGYITKDDMMHAFNRFANAHDYENKNKREIANEIVKHIQITDTSKRIGGKKTRVWKGAVFSKEYYELYDSDPNNAVECYKEDQEKGQGLRAYGI